MPLTYGGAHSCVLTSPASESESCHRLLTDVLFLVMHTGSVTRLTLWLCCQVLCDADLEPDRRLTVGYVSPDLFTHSVSYFAEAPLRHHCKDAVRLIVYNCVPKVPALAEHHVILWRACTIRRSITLVVRMAGRSVGAMLTSLTLIREQCVLNLLPSSAALRAACIFCDWPHWRHRRTRRRSC